MTGWSISTIEDLGKKRMAALIEPPYHLGELRIRMDLNSD
jgi:hypothetical protein